MQRAVSHPTTANMLKIHTTQTGITIIQCTKRELCRVGFRRQIFISHNPTGQSLRRMPTSTKPFIQPLIRNKHFTQKRLENGKYLWPRDSSKSITRSPVSNASRSARSASLSWKSNTAMFSAMRSARTDFGIGTVPKSSR